MAVLSLLGSGLPVWARSEPKGDENPANAAQNPAGQERREQPNATEPPANHDPLWFDKQLAREAGPLPERSLKAADGAFKARVAADILEPPKLIAGVQFVRLGIGAKTPMECWFQPAARDAADAVRAMSEAIFKGIERTYGTVEARLIQRTDAGSIGAAPFLAVNWLYRVRSKKGLEAGQVKHVVASMDGGVLCCVHNEPGYAETFARVFRSLVTSVEFAGVKTGPDYAEVHVFELGGQRVGFARKAFMHDANGATVIAEHTAMVVPLEPGMLNSLDTASMQFSTANGRLIKESKAKSENGQISDHLSLDRLADGTWQVTGTLHSKKFQATLEDRNLDSGSGTDGDISRLRRPAAAGRDTQGIRLGAEL